MVRSWVCPRCLGDLDKFYVEEGDTMVTDEKIVYPNCGYTLEGAIGECWEYSDGEREAGGSCRTESPR